MDNFDNTGRKVCCKVSLYKNVSGKVVAQSIAFRVVSIHWQGDDRFPLKSWLQVTYTLLKAASFHTFCLVAPQPQESEKEVQLHLTRTRHGLSNKPSIKVLKDEKSPAKFHYINTLSGKVIAQSIAFRVVSIYWQG